MTAENLAVKELLRSIVAEELPNSLAAFDIEADLAIADAFAGRRAPSVDRDAHSGFGSPDFATVSEFLKLVTATVTLILSLRSLHKKRPVAFETEELQARWVEQLKEAGFKEEKARRISSRFIRDFEATVKRTR